MSKTIIALSTAEQLASTIPDWQQYNIQSENVPDRLSRFQTADCILCLPDTPASFLVAAWKRFPQSRLFIAQNPQQWLDGQTRQSIDLKHALSSFVQPEKNNRPQPLPLPKQKPISQTIRLKV